MDINATAWKANSSKTEQPLLTHHQSYCPYCAKTKNTISSITKDAYIIELDEVEDGSEIQEALYELTGQKTVPNVFIGGEHIGGNSDVQELNSTDKLESKVKAVL